MTSMQRRIFTLIAIALLAVGLAACGSSSKKSSGSGSAAITIKNLTFTSTPVKAGSTVTVKNNDSFDHTVTADDNSFNVTVHGGSTATFTAPSAPGDVKFHCTIHSSMHGTLSVTS
jgi:plastocyanin